MDIRMVKDIQILHKSNRFHHDCNQKLKSRTAEGQHSREYLPRGLIVPTSIGNCDLILFQENAKECLDLRNWKKKETTLRYGRHKTFLVKNKKEMETQIQQGYKNGV